MSRVKSDIFNLVLHFLPFSHVFASLLAVPLPSFHFLSPVFYNKFLKNGGYGSISFLIYRMLKRHLFYVFNNGAGCVFNITNCIFNRLYTTSIEKQPENSLNPRFQVVFTVLFVLYDTFSTLSTDYSTMLC